ncbi:MULTISPECIES: DUF4396 domain-containing protein [unclassified Streptomyces]|uniref:DUF4396 domain-containing protein n=1 Tax=unclassified Streptomyces TaxID=2593676 RepID=UPI00168BABB3|nr:MULTISPECIES: DUF4396 domain-containing protein [unclassified Streptomyces]MBD3007712.1 DUF4396 domain-containing protein [Streptomyces sp. 5-10]
MDMRQHEHTQGGPHDHQDHGHQDHGHQGHGHQGPGHQGPGHQEHHGSATSWSMAAQATLHCLTGCAIGEVVGMAIGTALAWHNVPTMILAIVLAFVFGYSLTMRGVLRAGLDMRSALRVALAADTVSITIMELADNATIVVFPGAMDATLSDVLFWLSLALSFAVAFLVTTPVNRWMIARGKGHAVVHQYH